MNLNTFLDDTAAKHPGRTALVYPSGPDGGESSLSYRELRRSVLRAAEAFRSKGIRRGDCVAIVHRNDPAFILAYLGLARLAAVAVPINFMVKKAEELRFMLDHCGAKGVVTQREFLKGLLKARESLPGLKDVWVTDLKTKEEQNQETASPPRSEARPRGGRADTGDAGTGVASFWPFIESHEPFEGGAEIAGDTTASILYTSGTTGVPKGVMLTHANLTSNCDASIRAMAMSEKDVTITLLPMFHTFAWTACVLIPLRLGAKNVITASVTPPKPWLKQMGRHKVTIFAAVPQLYAVLAKQAAGLKGLILRYWFFRKVRICVSGAAPLSPATLQDFKRAFGRDIIEGYGLTETSPVATINPPGRPKAGSVGLPIQDVSIRIVDDAGRELPGGAEGEILIKGPNVMKGYYDNEEATRQAVSPDGWLKTGDIGLIDEDGYLFIRDRKKDMIIIKGLKVFSAQIEASLLSHPDIQEAAVIGVPDASGDERIKAFVVLREGAQAGTSELHKFCRQKFDPYKRPRDIEIMSELPKNALQKILKRVLRQKELEKRKA
ncbi:MAG: long-chain-fatty-acid--CoA ligase [Elusimicrobiota bacterium]